VVAPNETETDHDHEGRDLLVLHPFSDGGEPESARRSRAHADDRLIDRRADRSPLESHVDLDFVEPKTGDRGKGGAAAPEVVDRLQAGIERRSAG
jgi:hypothetical protein